MTAVETYIPLYRKYRPQSFADLVGQEAISLTLGHAISLNKVAHAYLFCGPRGTGKTSSARIFAKSLNCEAGPSATPCQTCASCTGITLGNALDVIEFDAASNNGVDDARELIESCQFAPMSGRFKIYIIDEVHMLTTQAFNALLKTLEEPPPNVVFIFATTEAHKVLPTIISRCQRFDFNRITTDQIVERLQYIAQQESIAIDAESLQAIARHSRGGMRDAVGLLDQLAVLGKVHPDTSLTQKDLLMLIGALEEDVLFQLTDAIAQRQAPILLEMLQTQINRGVEPTQLAKEIIQHVRNLMLVKAVGPNGDAKALGLMVEAYTRLVAQAALFEAAELPQMLSQLSQLDRTLRNTQHPQLWIEVGLLELTFREDILLVSQLAQRVSDLEARLAGGIPPQSAQPVAASRPAHVSQPLPQQVPVSPQAPPPVVAYPASPVAPSSSAPVPQHALMAPSQAASVPPAPQPPQQPISAVEGPSWQDVCARIASPPTKALLKQHFFLLKVDGNHLTIGCGSEPNLNIIKRPEKLIHLQKAVDDVFGQVMTLQLVLDKTPNHQASQQWVDRQHTKVPEAAPVVVAVPPVQSDPVVAAQTQEVVPVTQVAPLPAEEPHSVEPSVALPPQTPLVMAVEDTAPAFDEGPPLEDSPPFEDSALGPAFAPPMVVDQGASALSEIELVASEVVAPAESQPEAPEPVAVVHTPPTGSYDGSDLGASDEDAWHEARKFSLELLQGKVLE